MVVHPQFPAKSVPEFVAYAKANPGRLNIGTPGAGTPMRVVLELFKMTTGLNLARVDYRGDAPALADLLGQQVDVVFASQPGSIEYIRANRLRPLAIMSATRSPALPEIPVIGDFVSGLETSGWFGIVAPKTTPTGIIERLNKEINAALADPTIRVRFLISAQRWFPARPPSSASSSPTIQRNGPK
jgi:tripartite-type tricarboxylate transporter receptor subunit TctC